MQRLEPSIVGDKRKLKTLAKQLYEYFANASHILINFVRCLFEGYTTFMCQREPTYNYAYVLFFRGFQDS